MRILLLITSLLILSKAEAQDNDDVGFLPGYIVTKSRDTVRGLVKYRSPSRFLENIRFRETLEGKKKIYAAEDIRAYGVEGKIFHSFRAPGLAANQFMELVIDGYLRLYRTTVTITSRVPPGYTVPGSSGKWGTTYTDDKSNDYLLKKGERELFDPSAQFKKRVSEYLADHASISTKIRNGEYKKKDLEEIVRLYNESKKDN